MVCRALLCAVLSVVSGSFVSERSGPAAHYVIRTSDLGVTLQFLEEVFGLRVIRHEENPSACPITCNGKFATPWSKTMIGTETEDKAYALEVTYNYGVDAYVRGEGLRRFEMVVDDVATVVATAKGLGFVCEGATITGPDGYVYSATEKRAKSSPLESLAKGSPFAGVVLATTDVPATAAWYKETLGMSYDAASATLAFPDDAMRFHLEEVAQPRLGERSAVVRIEQWDGRNAFSLPSIKVRQIYDHLSQTAPERVVHDLQEINEETGLGVLLIAIISDPTGLEICLVSSEAFEPAIARAADFKRPDFERRKALMVEYAAAAAAHAAKQETALPF